MLNDFDDGVQVKSRYNNEYRYNEIFYDFCICVKNSLFKFLHYKIYRRIFQNFDSVK